MTENQNPFTSSLSTQPIGAPVESKVDEATTHGGDLCVVASSCLHWYQRPFAGLIVGTPDKVDADPANPETPRSMARLYEHAARSEAKAQQAAAVA